MDWISKPVALWDWDNPLPPPSPAVTIAAFAADDLSGDPPSSVDGSSVVDAPPLPSTAVAAPPAPQLGLGLGKRTYFEGEKRAEKKGGNAHGTRCQVEGCGADLSSAKDYHRKHRVCEGHSKCPKVVVAGQDRRFCQQCSRFHALAEFDQKKRSCRRRLSDHNARRRKPQPDSFSFSSRLSSPFYDERRQISFMWNKAPFQVLRQQTSWADESDFKIANSIEFQIKACNPNPNPNLLDPFPIAAEGFKGSPPVRVLSQGPEARAPDNNLRRALSLLSSSTSSPPLQNSKNTPASPAWHDPASSLFHFNCSSSPSPPPVPPPPVTLGGQTGGYWFDEQQSASFSVQNGGNGGVHFQEFRVLKPAVQYETAAFFDSNQIH